MRLFSRLSLALLLALPLGAWADNNNVVNVYAWSGEVTDAAIQQFEKETGIKVNFTTYDSNEVMYAKLKADPNSQYDVIEPSSYYVDRMRKQGMLEKLDKSKLPLFKNLNPSFLNKPYDPQSAYSMPFIWGVTGIFVNSDYRDPKSITSWKDLWNPKYKDQLMLLDDSREVFSMALLTLGYSPNDSNPEHIKQAYLKLKDLLPNVKIFNSSPISIVIDEDTNVGMVWNGDLYRAHKENAKVDFIFPKDGFVIWVDNFAIAKNSPHKANAYKFLNFLLRADVDKNIVLEEGYPTANQAAQKALPPEMRDNPTVYPSADTLRRGVFQTDIDDDALALYEKYWERLKMGG